MGASADAGTSEVETSDPEPSPGERASAVTGEGSASSCTGAGGASPESSDLQALADLLETGVTVAAAATAAGATALTPAALASTKPLVAALS